MKSYWLFLLFSLVRSSESRNKSTYNITPLVLNGHYVKWPSRTMEQKFINEKQFIPKNVIYTRFQLYSENIYLVAPRFMSGVPFTLGNTVHNNKDKCYSYVSPYPCMDKQDAAGIGTCVGGSLVNAVDLVMGQDGVLWVLDIGISNTLSDHPSRDGEPKIIGFEIATGKIKHLVALRTLTCRAQSRLQYLAVEYTNDTTTMLYVGDGGTRSIVVWNVQTNEGYRVKLPHTIVQGCVDNPLDDVFYTALVEHPTGNYVYFTYLYSQDLFRARTKDFQKRMNVKCIVNMGKKPFKMVFVGVGYGSILYFRIKSQNDLYSWDTVQTFIEENFMMVRKSKDCRTITHVDVDDEGVLWALESNIQDFIANRVGCFGPSMLLTSVLEPPTPMSDEHDKRKDSSRISYVKYF